MFGVMRAIYKPGSHYSVYVCVRERRERLRLVDPEKRKRERNKD